MYRCLSWYEFDVSTSWIVPAIYPVVIRCITLPRYSRSTLSPTVRHLSTVLQDLYYYHQPKLIYVLPLISMKYPSLSNISLHSSNHSQPLVLRTHLFFFRVLHSSSAFPPVQPFISMSFYQSGPNASAHIGTFNDVGRDQNNFHGNEVFKIFVLYITINNHKKISYRQYYQLRREGGHTSSSHQT